MTRWSDVTDRELDARLAAELQTLTDSARVSPEWTRLELLPAVRSRLHRPAPVAPSRLSPVLGLAGAIGAVAVLGVLLLVFFSRPPNTAAPTATPPSSTVRQGDFTLTISAGKAVYAPGEPIDVEAVLTYDGPGEEVELAGVAHLINGFSTRQLDGPLSMGPAWEVPCLRHELRRAEPLRRAYVKSAGWSEDDPNADFYRQWSQQPGLTLPAGLWEVTAYSEFAVGPDCGGEQVSLEAAIELRIGDVRAEASPSPEATPELTAQPTEPQAPSDSQAVETGVGSFELSIAAGRAEYAAGEPIDIAAELVYDGPADSTTVCAGAILVGFGYTQLDGELDMIDYVVPAIGLGYDLEAGEPFRQAGIPLRGLGYDRDDPNADFYAEWSQGPFLWLPAGEWRISAESWFGTGERCDDAVTLSASVVIPVTDGPAESPAPTPPPATSPPATPTPPSAVGEFACDPLYFTLADRTRIVTSCTTIWPTDTGGDTPSVSNPDGDPTVLEIVWLLQDPRACGPEPPRTTVTLTRLARLPMEPAEPGPYLLRLETQLQPGTGCRTVAGWQGVRLALSQPVDADEVMVLIDGGSEPRSTADTDHGSFELTVGASKEAYAAGESIEVEASLRYDGAEPTIFASGGEPLIAFSVEQLDGDLEMPGGIAESCNRYVLHRGSPLRQPFTKSVAYGEDDPNADFYRRWYEDPEFTLPPGTWRITADSRFEPGFDCADSVSLRASVVIVVAAAPDAEIPLRTSPPNTTGVCHLAAGGGRLAPHPGTGLGVADALGEVMPVVWPFGYTARREGDQVMLVDFEGRVVAREGDQIRFAVYAVDDAFFACGAVELAPPRP